MATGNIDEKCDALSDEQGFPKCKETGECVYKGVMIHIYYKDILYDFVPCFKLNYKEGNYGKEKRI